MNARKILHVSAIVFSSLASLAANGYAKAEVTKKTTKKSGEAASSKHTSGAHASNEASQDPPRKLDMGLMQSAEFSTPQVLNFTPPAPENLAERTRYPWKRQIVTTTFWIGEAPSKNNPVPNQASSWDEKWAENYGGTDNPKAENRADYQPASFTPRQNPFYVALPYNDVQKGVNKDEASKVIPWFAKEFKTPGRSVCKGRWLAIRYQDRVCYAQWEDCGPFRTDHWEYVFGNDRPKPNLNRGAGLDVSPAVRDYLGMNDTDVTSWRFVDFDEIPTGPWARLGENNTFVQNARSGTTSVAQATKAKTPVTLRE